MPGEEAIMDEDARDWMYERWYQLATPYSHRKLTYESDKLPAISGLAQDMAQFTHDKFLVGIGKRDIAQGLPTMGSFKTP